MWIKAKNRDERIKIYNKLKEINFAGNSCFYIMSNIDYVHMDQKNKSFHFGCRYPSTIKKEDVISYDEFLSWFRVLLSCEINRYIVEEMTIDEKQNEARKIVSLRDDTESWRENALEVINRADKDYDCEYAVDELLKRPDLSYHSMVMMSYDWDYLD